LMLFPPFIRNWMTRRRHQRRKEKKCGPFISVAVDDPVEDPVDFFAVADAADMWVKMLDAKSALAVRRSCTQGRDIVDSTFGLLCLRRAFQKQALVAKLLLVFQAKRRFGVMRPTSHMGEKHTCVLETYTSVLTRGPVIVEWQPLEADQRVHMETYRRVPIAHRLGERDTGDVERYPLLAAEAKAVHLSEGTQSGVAGDPWPRTGFIGLFDASTLTSVFSRMLDILEQPNAVLMLEPRDKSTNKRDPWWFDQTSKWKIKQRREEDLAYDPLGLGIIARGYQPTQPTNGMLYIAGWFFIDSYSIKCGRCIRKPMPPPSPLPPTGTAGEWS
jgi:hypothetical protein